MITTTKEFKEFMKRADEADYWNDIEVEEWEDACEYVGLNYHDYEFPEFLWADLEKKLNEIEEKEGNKMNKEQLQEWNDEQGTNEKMYQVMAYKYKKATRGYVEEDGDPCYFTSDDLEEAKKFFEQQSYYFACENAKYKMTLEKASQVYCGCLVYEAIKEESNL